VRERPSALRLQEEATGKFRFGHEIFLSLFVAIRQAWEQKLTAEGVIDFEDMLNLATDHLEAGRWSSPFELVMVDEFQDASRARARMARALVNRPGRYLFAVGDDWQSITSAWTRVEVEWRAHPTHVFTYEGKPVVQVNTKAWRNALQRAGIFDFRWHDLRHTFATWHREAGTPTHELQRRLGGWKTQSMVERYAHVAPEGLQFAASRLDTLMQGCGVVQAIYQAGRDAK